MEEFHSLPPTKGLAEVCIWGTLWLYTTFFRGISLYDFSNYNPMYEFRKNFGGKNHLKTLFQNKKN